MCIRDSNWVAKAKAGQLSPPVPLNSVDFCGSGGKTVAGFGTRRWCILRDVVKWFLYSFAFGVLLVGDLAQATDARTAGTTVDIPYRPYDDWTGFYLGGHVGYGRPNKIQSNHRKAGTECRLWSRLSGHQ